MYIFASNPDTSSRFAIVKKTTTRGKVDNIYYVPKKPSSSVHEDVLFSRPRGYLIQVGTAVGFPNAFLLPRCNQHLSKNIGNAISWKPLDIDENYQNFNISTQKFEEIEAVINTAFECQSEDSVATLLHWAARCNKTWSISQFLLDTDHVDVMARNSSGRTALEVAEIFGSKEAFTILLAHITQNKLIKIEPLPTIVKTSNQSLHDICSKAKIDISALRNILKTQSIEVNTLDEDGYTALHLVIKNSCDPEAVELLLNSGADPNRTTQSNTNILSSDLIEILDQFMIRPKYDSSIEMAFYYFWEKNQDKKANDILYMLIARRPSREAFAMEILDKFLNNSSSKLNKDLLNNYVSQLTGYDVKELFDKYKYRYQAHLLSKGGFAQSDIPGYQIITEEIDFSEVTILDEIFNGKTDFSEQKLTYEEMGKINNLIQVNKLCLTNNFSKEKRWLYLLNEFLRGKWRNQMLEGFNPLFYHPIKIRCLFQIVFNLMFEKNFSTQQDIEILKSALIREIILSADAHRFSIDVMLANVCDPDNELSYLDPKLSFAFSKTRRNLSPIFEKTIISAVVEHLYNQISTLSIGSNSAHCYVTAGFLGHAIYVNFSNVKNKILIRIDNLGDGVNYHQNVSKLDKRRLEKIDSKRKYNKEHTRSQEHYRYPYVLEVKLSEMQRIKHYLQNILLSPYMDRESALSALYVNHSSQPTKKISCLRLLTIKELEAIYPSKRIQLVGNCVVKNNQIGLQIRLGEVQKSFGGAGKHDNYYENYCYRCFRAEELKYLDLKEVIFPEENLFSTSLEIAQLPQLKPPKSVTARNPSFFFPASANEQHNQNNGLVASALSSPSIASSSSQESQALVLDPNKITKIIAVLNYTNDSKKYTISDLQKDDEFSLPFKNEVSFHCVFIFKNSKNILFKRLTELADLLKITGWLKEHSKDQYEIKISGIQNAITLFFQYLENRIAGVEFVKKDQLLYEEYPAFLIHTETLPEKIILTSNTTFESTQSTPKFSANLSSDPIQKLDKNLAKKSDDSYVNWTWSKFFVGLGILAGLAATHAYFLNKSSARKSFNYSLLGWLNSSQNKPQEKLPRNIDRIENSKSTSCLML